MSVELGVALVGVVGALTGAVVQYVLGEVTRVRRGRNELRDKWAEVLIELLKAGQAAERFMRGPAEQQTTRRRDELTVQLDETSARIYLVCPLELTHPATEYLQLAHAALRGDRNIDAIRQGLDGAEQRLGLVFRHVSGINRALPRSLRGDKAKKGIAPKYR